MPMQARNKSGTASREAAASSVKTTSRSAERAVVRDVIRKYGRRRRAVIQVLQDLQDRSRWLSPETLEAVARELKMPLAHVFSVATFYKSFSLAPRGRHICTVCMGTACHVRGGATVLEHFERRLGLRTGQTSPDGEVTLERVNCLGACALAPLAVVDGRYYGQMSESKADKVLQPILHAGCPGPVPENGPEDEKAP
jgi:NADH-quinone oxidoreductase subunit E